MKASAWAVFIVAKSSASWSVDQRAFSARSIAMAFQWPGGVKVPAPSAQKAAIRFWSAVSFSETA
jgi:hypothetical protein